MGRDRTEAVPVALDRAQIETRLYGPGAVPNNPRLPVMLARGALSGPTHDRAIHALYRANGWGGAWTWTVFDYHHYHPNAHEALAVASGEAVLMLGGPEGEEVPVAAGDLLVLPAGTGHRRLSASADFAVCGGYPPGQEDYETLRADEPAEDAATRIAAVGLPETDPFWGRDGPLIRLWSDPGDERRER